MSGSNKKTTKKTSIPLIERLLSTSVSALIVGKNVGVNIVGDKREISAVSNALIASKNLQETLNRTDVTIDLVMEKLRVKKECAREFEKIIGIPWPL